MFFTLQKTSMKKSIHFVLILLAPLFSRAQVSDPLTIARLGDAAPTFNFHISERRIVNLHDYKGKIVMINFFATWCVPCRYELNRVQDEIWHKYQDNPNFALFSFGYQEGWSEVLPFKEKRGYTFLMLPDESGKIFKLFAAQSIPRTVVIDQDQKIIYQSIGYNENELKKLVRLLDQKLK
jgi:peroxiredoxin